MLPKLIHVMSPEVAAVASFVIGVIALWVSVRATRAKHVADSRDSKGVAGEGLLARVGLMAMVYAAVGVAMIGLGVVRLID